MVRKGFDWVKRNDSHKRGGESFLKSSYLNRPSEYFDWDKAIAMLHNTLKEVYG